MKGERIAMMREGRTDAEIARQAGVLRSTVRQLRTACGIPQSYSRDICGLKIVRGSLTEAILATLSEVRPLPVSTPDLVALHGGKTARPRTDTWASLKRLIKAGLVEQTGKFKGENGYIAYWRATDKTS